MKKSKGKIRDNQKARAAKRKSKAINRSKGLRRRREQETMFNSQSPEVQRMIREVSTAQAARTPSGEGMGASTDIAYKDLPDELKAVIERDGVPTTDTVEPNGDVEVHSSTGKIGEIPTEIEDVE